MKAHVLIADLRDGDYINLCHQKVHLNGNEFICGGDFKEQRKVRIISSDSIAVDNGSFNSADSLHRSIP